MSDTVIAVTCTRCGKAVEVCDCCEEPGCKHVICNECLKLAVGERRPRTYTVAEKQQRRRSLSSGDPVVPVAGD